MPLFPIGEDYGCFDTNVSAADWYSDNAFGSNNTLRRHDVDRSIEWTSSIHDFSTQRRRRLPGKHCSCSIICFSAYAEPEPEPGVAAVWSLSDELIILRHSNADFRSQPGSTFSSSQPLSDEHGLNPFLQPWSQQPW